MTSMFRTASTIGVGTGRIVEDRPGEEVALDRVLVAGLDLDPLHRSVVRWNRRRRGRVGGIEGDLGQLDPAFGPDDWTTWNGVTAIEQVKVADPPSPKSRIAEAIRSMPQSDRPRRGRGRASARRRTAIARARWHSSRCPSAPRRPWRGRGGCCAGRR